MAGRTARKRNGNDPLSARVISIESELEHVAENQTKHSETMGRLFTAIDRIQEQIGKITVTFQDQITISHEKLSQEITSLARSTGKTNWAVIISALGVMLAFMMHYTNLTLAPIHEYIKSREGVQWDIAHHKMFKESLYRELDIRKEIFQGEMKFLEHRIGENEEHRRQLGHPFVQTERIDGLETMNQLTTDDRIRRSEVLQMMDAIRKDIAIIEQTKGLISG